MPAPMFRGVPRNSVEFAEAAWHGLAGPREELLHQPLFVLPQGFELPAVRRDQVVQRAEAVGDLLLLGLRFGSGKQATSGFTAVEVPFVLC